MCGSHVGGGDREATALFTPPNGLQCKTSSAQVVSLQFENFLAACALLWSSPSRLELLHCASTTQPQILIEDGNLK